MHRKFVAICTALAAFAAFAIIPAMASATSPILTHKGTVVAVGTKITATSEGESQFLGGGITVSCNHNWMTGSVHKNSATEIMGTIESASFNGTNAAGETSDCTSTLFGDPVKVTIPALTNAGGKSHWCIYAGGLLKPNQFELRGANCTVAGGELTFILDFTGGPTCKFKRTASVTGSYTTNTSPATLKLEDEPEFTLHGSEGFGCPASGKLRQLNFTLYTDSANDLNEPLTIS